jgi:tetratricopeptide (TPR) repeat protein
MYKILLAMILMIACSVVLGQAKQEGERLLQKGSELMEQGKYQEAVLLFDECIAGFPVLTEAFLGRAMAREQLKDYSGAITDYSVFLEKYPQHFEALLGRANTRYQAGQFEKARADYTALLSVPRSETNYVMFQKGAAPGGNMQITTAQSNVLPQILNYLGLTEYRLKDFEKAIHWLDSAIKLEPGNADYHVNRGMVLESTNPDRAMADYEMALKLVPNHPLALHNIGVLKAKKGGPEDYFEKAIESDSTMLSPYLERAYLRMQSGYYKGALEDYNSAIDIEKNDPEIWLNRGFAKEKLNDLKGAYADYSQAIQLDENFEKAWLNRGNVLSRQNNHKDAIDDYTVALTINSEYAAAYYNRAIAREKNKQKDEACADLKKAEQFGIAPDARLKAAVCP